MKKKQKKIAFTLVADNLTNLKKKAKLNKKTIWSSKQSQIEGLPCIKNKQKFNSVITLKSFPIIQCCGRPVSNQCVINV